MGSLHWMSHKHYTVILPTEFSVMDPMMPGTVAVAHVIKVPFRLGDIINESVEVLHGRLGPVTAFTAVKGGHGGGDEGWPLQLKTARCSNSRVQFGDDVIHCVVLPSLLLGMLQVNCTAVFGQAGLNRAGHLMHREVIALTIVWKGKQISAMK